jgi:hypothetical protein
VSKRPRNCILTFENEDIILPPNGFHYPVTVSYDQKNGVLSNTAAKISELAKLMDFVALVFSVLKNVESEQERVG